MLNNWIILLSGPQQLVVNLYDMIYDPKVKWRYDIAFGLAHYKSTGSGEQLYR